MNKLIENIKKTPPEKLLIYGVAGFALYKIYNVLFNSAQDQKNTELEKENSKELNALLKKYKLTYSPANYLAFANTIYEGTKYGLGDNYEAVETTLLKMNNDADVAKLIQAYGSRQNYIFGIPAGEKRDLLTNLRAELGSDFGGVTSYRLDRVNKNWKLKRIKYIL